MTIFIKRLAFAAILILGGPALADEMFVRISSPQSEKDNRASYVHVLIKTALDATKEQFGDYKIEYFDSVVSPLREKSVFKTGKEINLAWQPVMQAKDYDEFSSPIPIPILKGILGYRIFLIHKDNEELFAKVKSKADLKRLVVGQRQGWGDVAIFRHNGFSVMEGSSYEGLFAMVENKRFDYFSRGIGEAWQEYETRKHAFPNLRSEKTIALYYPYPVFFYVHNDSPALKRRLHEGLQNIIQDGSFETLFFNFYQEIIEKSSLSTRKLFILETPNLPSYVPESSDQIWLDLTKVVNLPK